MDTNTPVTAPNEIPQGYHSDKLPSVEIADMPPTPSISESDSAVPISTSEDPDLHQSRNLLDELSSEEKVALLSGTSFTETAGVPRLAIPQLKVSDSINGVRGSQSHLEDKGTACFPSTTCLASTWNTHLLQDFGHEVGIQAKLKAVQIVIGPNVNLHRDPRGGRNFETFSEDPLLTGKLAAAIINGMQSTGVGACAKHFAGNESETKRRKYNVRSSANGRTMREIYMKAFQFMLRESNPVSIMMAYNRLDGHYCSQSPLIQTVLRDNWGYDGCIMSDWYGTRAGAESLRAGLDLEMPGPSVFRGKRLLEELANGSVSDSDIDRATLSVLQMIDRTKDSHSNESEQTIVCERTSSIARRLATEGIVLLKNDQTILPLDIRKAGSVAVIGAPAETPVISGGGSACAQPQYSHSFLKCLRRVHPRPELVRYARGVNPYHCAPALPVSFLKSDTDMAGIRVDYYNNGSSTPVHSETLDNPQVVMLGRLKPGLEQQNFHYVINTTLTIPVSGRHTLGAQVTGDFTLELNNKIILEGAAPNITVEDFLFVPKRLERTTRVLLEANKQYNLRLTVKSRVSVNNGEPTPHAAKLVFQEAFEDRQSIAEAVSLAASSDTSIIFAGRTHENESEGFDLENIELNKDQIRLIKAVSAVSKNTILVLHHGNPIDLSPIIDDVQTVIAAHFPGQEGASALTDIILGHVNPSGRLATTWPMRLDETCVPSFKNFPCTDSDDPEISYEEGLQLGYRHPLAPQSSRFPFGHGLSYSSFETADLKVTRSPGQEILPYTERTLTASVTVHNSGPFPGKHVVQLYVEAPQTQLHPSGPVTNGIELDSKISNTTVWRPTRELIVFAKPDLMPGETKTVQMTFLQRDVTSTWDEESSCWRARSGKYEFVVADNAVAGVGAQQNTGVCKVAMELDGDGELWNGL